MMAVMTLTHMFEDFGEEFDHVPSDVLEYASWLMTLPMDRLVDEKSSAAWCRKHKKGDVQWGARLQAEPEFQRLLQARTVAMGFTPAHFQAVWENYFRIAATGTDHRAARSFLVDTHQILPPEPPKEEDGIGEDEEETLLARHRELVMRELPAGPTQSEGDNNQ